MCLNDLTDYNNMCSRRRFYLLNVFELANIQSNGDSCFKMRILEIIKSGVHFSCRLYMLTLLISLPDISRMKCSHLVWECNDVFPLQELAMCSILVKLKRSALFWQEHSNTLPQHDLSECRGPKCERLNKVNSSPLARKKQNALF